MSTTTAELAVLLVRRGTGARHRRVGVRWRTRVLHGPFPRDARDLGSPARRVFLEDSALDQFLPAAFGSYAISIGNVPPVSRGGKLRVAIEREGNRGS